MAEFFHMGGYAFYVWSSFGLVAAVLTANVVSAIGAHRRLRKALQAGLAARESGGGHASGT